LQANKIWALVLSACGLLVVGVLFTVFTGSEETSGEESGRRVATVRSNKTPLSKDFIKEQIEEAKKYTPPTIEETVLDVIAGHWKKVEANPESPETPALLMAMGNLYRLDLQDYEMAAYCYHRVLEEYPDYPGRMQIYPELATCYENAGDHERMLRVYREMTQVFPENSEQALFARVKLGLEDWNEGEGRRPRLYNMEGEAEGEKEGEGEGEGSEDTPEINEGEQTKETEISEG
jgi:tetratricopeptide (TPR) repeat protein